MYNIKLTDDREQCVIQSIGQRVIKSGEMRTVFLGWADRRRLDEWRVEWSDRHYAILVLI